MKIRGPDFLKFHAEAQAPLCQGDITAFKVFFFAFVPLWASQAPSSLLHSVSCSFRTLRSSSSPLKNYPGRTQAVNILISYDTKVSILVWAVRGSRKAAQGILHIVH